MGQTGSIDELVAQLAAAARGGRVAHSGFLDPAEADELAAGLRQAGVATFVDGGYSGALRRVVTAYPEHLPVATTPLTALYFPQLDDEGALRAACRAAGVDGSNLGDIVRHQDGLSLVTLAPPDERLLRLSRVAGQPTTPEEVPLERLARGAARTLSVVVPSLRLDALGAKAFRVSRAFFAKGVAGGKVTVNGRPAGKSSSVAVGDSVFADGLGRFTVAAVEGETRRGNLKVVLEVERAS